MGNELEPYRKFNKKRTAAVCRLAAKGLPKKHIAAKVGIGVATLRDWLDPMVGKSEAHAEFRIAFDKARAEHQERLLGKIEDASEDPRNWKAASWLLERIYPLEYGERKHINHTAPQAGMTQAQFEKLDITDQEAYVKALQTMEKVMLLGSGEE